jgi:hypothetical protein
MQEGLPNSVRRTLSSLTSGKRSHQGSCADHPVVIVTDPAAKHANAATITATPA